jgi:hypothetical protein
MTMSNYTIEQDEETDMYHVVSWTSAQAGRTGSILARFHTYRSAVEYMLDQGLVPNKTVDY